MNDHKTAQSTTEQYWSQIPKFKSLSGFDWFGIVAGTCSIVSLVTAPFLDSPTTASMVHTASLSSILLVVLFLYFAKDRKKLHRYAQAVFYLHYVNHSIRNHLATLQKGNSSNIDGLAEKILDAISECYSILTGKRCRACIKQLNSDFKFNKEFYGDGRTAKKIVEVMMK